MSPVAPHLMQGLVVLAPLQAARLNPASSAG